MKRCVAALSLLIALACQKATSPTDPGNSQLRGKLAGLVIIGPNCPVQTIPPCSTPPAAYLARKILVYDAARSKLLHTVDIDTFGLYSISLVPADYLVDLKTTSTLDRTSDLPKKVTVRANAITTLNVTIDTGIR